MDIQLSDKRKVTIQDFRGKTLVSIREFYRKDGKELPSSKGKYGNFAFLMLASLPLCFVVLIVSIQMSSKF